MEMNMPWDRSSLARRCLVAATCSVFRVRRFALAAPAAAREFRAADIQEENYPTVLALRYMDQLVTQRTGGRHRIRVFHSAPARRGEPDHRQTRVGAIDMNRINVGAMGNVTPILNVLALPFLFRSVDHLYKVRRRADRDEILGELESSGLIGLTFYDLRCALDLHHDTARCMRSTTSAAAAAGAAIGSDGPG